MFLQRWNASEEICRLTSGKQFLLVRVSADSFNCAECVE